MDRNGLYCEFSTGWDDHACHPRSCLGRAFENLRGANLTSISRLTLGKVFLKQLGITEQPDFLLQFRHGISHLKGSEWGISWQSGWFLKALLGNSTQMRGRIGKTSDRACLTQTEWVPEHPLSGYIAQIRCWLDSSWLCYGAHTHIKNPVRHIYVLLFQSQPSQERTRGLKWKGAPTQACILIKQGFAQNLGARGRDRFIVVPWRWRIDAQGAGMGKRWVRWVPHHSKVTSHFGSVLLHTHSDVGLLDVASQDTDVGIGFSILRDIAENYWDSNSWAYKIDGIADVLPQGEAESKVFFGGEQAASCTRWSNWGAANFLRSGLGFRWWGILTRLKVEVAWSSSKQDFCFACKFRCMFHLHWDCQFMKFLFETVLTWWWYFWLLFRESRYHHWQPKQQSSHHPASERCRRAQETSRVLMRGRCLIWHGAFVDILHVCFERFTTKHRDCWICQLLSLLYLTK